MSSILIKFKVNFTTQSLEKKISVDKFKYHEKLLGLKDKFVTENVIIIINLDHFFQTWVKKVFGLKRISFTNIN